MTQAKDRQRKAYQDSVGIEDYKGKYRLNFSRKLSRAVWNVDQKRVGTGLSACPENLAKVEETATKIHLDILRDDFDATLDRYGLGGQPKLTVIEPIRSKQLSVLEVYDKYVQSREGEVAETYFELDLKGRFRRAIARAVEAANNNALAIKDFLLKNGSRETAKNCLSYLEKAYQLGIEHDYVDKNPFVGMAAKIKLGKGKGKSTDNHNKDDEDSDTRAFTVDEMNAIIRAFEFVSSRRHLAPIIKFLFWTGCRTGEAIALKWRDVKWDRELIIFRRTYNYELKLFKPTKTGVARFFPMPKDGQLWQLLKSLPERGLDDVVFPSKTGRTIDRIQLSKVWHGTPAERLPGVINELIEQGKVSQYLKLYATRHTFISHQVNIHKIPITTVAQWAGNGAMVANNSYLDRDKLTVPGYEVKPKEEVTKAEPNQALVDLIAGLTPEQVEQMKALLESR